MREMRQARFRVGQEVLAATELYNDGSLPEAPEDVLLVAAGGPGEVVQVGRHAEADLPVYMVDFGLAVVGCLEAELLPAAARASP
jgi:nitrogen fixation protein NifZ